MSNFKPDYGLYLKSNGYSNSIDIHFYAIKFDHICKVNNDLYSIMVNKEENNQEYAVSLDFDNSILGRLLEKLPISISKKVSNEFSKFDFNYTVEFEGIAQIGLVANLGELQKGQYEGFIPLVIKEIS
jgi:hypothetical protein